jgi:hypothetical protein
MSRHRRRIGASRLRPEGHPRRPPELWSLNLGGCIESTPAIWRGSIYVGTRGDFSSPSATGSGSPTPERHPHSSTPGATFQSKAGRGRVTPADCPAPGAPPPGPKRTECPAKGPGLAVSRAADPRCREYEPSVKLLFRGPATPGLRPGAAVLLDGGAGLPPLSVSARCQGGFSLSAPLPERQQRRLLGGAGAASGGTRRPRLVVSERPLSLPDAFVQLGQPRGTTAGLVGRRQGPRSGTPCGPRCNRRIGQYERPGQVQGLRGSQRCRSGCVDVRFHGDRRRPIGPGVLSADGELVVNPISLQSGW